jgi:hypothetical protein
VSEYLVFAAGHGKKAYGGTMTWLSALKSNPAVAKSPETQTLMPATTAEAPDILMNCKTKFCVGT